MQVQIEEGSGTEESEQEERPDQLKVNGKWGERNENDDRQESDQVAHPDLPVQYLGIEVRNANI